MPRNQALQALQDRSSYSKTTQEILTWSYYDRMKIDGTTPTLVNRLFTIPLGQAGKTLADTNLPNASQLPQGQSFQVNAIKVFYFSRAVRSTANIQQIYTLLQDTVLELIVPGKDTLGTWTLEEIMGSSTMIALTPTAAGDNIPLIQPNYVGVKRLKRPWVIGAVQTFEVRLTTVAATSMPAALDNDKLKIALCGILNRMA